MLLRSVKYKIPRHAVFTVTHEGWGPGTSGWGPGTSRRTSATLPAWSSRSSATLSASLKFKGDSLLWHKTEALFMCVTFIGNQCDITLNICHLLRITKLLIKAQLIHRNYCKAHQITSYGVNYR